jgi:membrane protease YdiL (CAAX protease family)
MWQVGQVLLLLPLPLLAFTPILSLLLLLLLLLLLPLPAASRRCYLLMLLLLVALPFLLCSFPLALMLPILTAGATSPYSLFVGLLPCLPVPQPKVHYEQVLGEGQVLLDEGQHTTHCGAVTA